VVSLALASYNGGPGQVEEAHGVPPDAASYVTEIENLAAIKYAAETASGSAAVAAAESALGTPYQYGGSCTDPHGADPSGWCDCSSLVQMAWATARVSLPRTTYAGLLRDTGHIGQQARARGPDLHPGFGWDLLPRPRRDVRG
jgi:cell wall-associated NlpC family hydrolase